MRSQGYGIPLLALAILSPWPSQQNPGSNPRVLLVSAALVNITVDDTSSLIAYTPATSWQSSTTVCSSCLQPDPALAYAGTWHDGTHIIPTADEDDSPGGTQELSQSTQVSQKSSTRSATPTPPPTQAKGKGDDDDDDGKGDDDDDKKSGNDGHRRRTVRVARDAKLFKRDNSSANSNPFVTEKDDSDDPGFVDQPVVVTFNFTGSAVYLYALVPQFAAATNTTPTFVNLTYTIDSEPAGQFLHSGSPSITPSPTSYLSSVAVLQRSGLSNGPHSLVINVGPDSVCLLDYIVYSQDSPLWSSGGSSAGSSSGPNSSNGAGNTSGSQPTTSVGAASPTGAMNQATNTTTPSSTKSHSVATFAGAVGGSVGLLSVLALALAFSLYRRRLKARRRDRAYRQGRGGDGSSVSSFHTDASEDGPPMQGPAPFVPRYFPGTVINTAPPAYSPPAPPSNEATSSLLGPEAPVPSISWYSRRSGGASGDSDSASYADRPPPTPPLNPLAGAAEVEDMYFAPPPSFQMAIASPIPAILAGLSGTTASESSSPALRSSSPSPPSPVIPLLAPPPSARPVSFTITGLQTPSTSPSASRTLVVSEPSVSPRSSTRSLRIQASEDSSSEAQNDSGTRSSSDAHPLLQLDSVAESPLATLPDTTTSAQESGRNIGGSVGGGNSSSR
ncbi:hypothetical protein BC835DRAFT_617879 [Cytidiella melzeri]|nr:hypothetical protein BC835DRAFT_617879 [Cytidiella melzeri]